jgi:hypothetical protein
LTYAASCASASSSRPRASGAACARSTGRPRPASGWTTFWLLSRWRPSRPPPKLYKLEVQISERSQSPLVDTETGRADSATLFGEADYTLTSLDGSRVIAKGRASGSATYDRSTQRFAAVRAARDAEIRLSKLLSEQIRTRLAARFVSGAPL